MDAATNLGAVDFRYSVALLYSLLSPKVVEWARSDSKLPNLHSPAPGFNACIKSTNH
jgi:hypothetical protein